MRTKWPSGRRVPLYTSNQKSVFEGFITVARKRTSTSWFPAKEWKVDFYESFIITTAVPITLENYLLCFAFTQICRHWGTRARLWTVQSNDSQLWIFERVGLGKIHVEKRGAAKIITKNSCPNQPVFRWRPVYTVVMVLEHIKKRISSKGEKKRLESNSG